MVECGGLLNRCPGPNLGPGVRIPSSPLARRRLPAAVLFLVCLGACAERSLDISSNPPGADVFVDNAYVGRTPVRVPFTHGGMQEIIILPRPADGAESRSYRPAVIRYDSERFEHDTPVVDLIAELPLIAADDRQAVDVELKPDGWRELYRADPQAFRDSVRTRAEALRVRVRDLQAIATPTESELPGVVDTRPAQRADSGPESRSTLP